MRFALITHLDTVFRESDDLGYLVKIRHLLGKDTFRGIFDYKQNVYLDEVAIIDEIGVAICDISS